MLQQLSNGNENHAKIIKQRLNKYLDILIEQADKSLLQIQKTSRKSNSK